MDYIHNKAGTPPPPGIVWDTREFQGGYERIALMDGAGVMFPNNQYMKFRKYAIIKFFKKGSQVKATWDVKDVISSEFKR